MLSFFVFARRLLSSFFSFFFNDTATTEIYTLSLHDALPIYARRVLRLIENNERIVQRPAPHVGERDHFDYPDRKSTRLNSSHGYISYAVFCLKKKNPRNTRIIRPRR